jgi:hypothetical protein
MQPPLRGGHPCRLGRGQIGGEPVVEAAPSDVQVGSAVAARNGM